MTPGAGGAGNISASRPAVVLDWDWMLLTSIALSSSLGKWPFLGLSLVGHLSVQFFARFSIRVT
jgi:hypothetical protein